MIFKEMDPEEIHKAIEGHTNIIKPEVEDIIRFFKTLSCHRCGSEVRQIVNARVPFSSGKILPNYLAKCVSCNCEFEPYTKIEVCPPKT